MAVLEINRNDINWTMCPMDPTCTRQEHMKPVLFCHWDLYQHEKWMPPSPNWDGLPIWHHFQNGHQRSKITFLFVTYYLGSIEPIFCFQMRSYLGYLAPIFHSCMGRYQWPLKSQGLKFAINNCSSRSSSHSEQISAGVCDELRLVLRCLCSNVCAEKGVQYCKVTTNCWKVMMG